MIGTSRRTYLSLLSTDAYLPGAVVLHASLTRTQPRYPFLLLVTPNVSPEARRALAQRGIAFEALDQVIPNPNALDAAHRWRHNYSQLHIFNQTRFDKLVYLDADMFVQQNIDELFDHPHMSAVNAGGMLPEYAAAWSHLNGGLMVVEPSATLFADMLRRVGTIERGAAGGGNQAFLHAYFSDWPSRHELHLDHRYNVFHTHLDRYRRLLGYTLDDVKVVHFTGDPKPWSTAAPAKLGLGERILRRWRRRVSHPLRNAAFRRWRACCREVDGLALPATNRPADPRQAAR